MSMRSPEKVGPSKMHAPKDAAKQDPAYEDMETPKAYERSNPFDAVTPEHSRVPQTSHQNLGRQMPGKAAQPKTSIATAVAQGLNYFSLPKSSSSTTTTPVANDSQAEDPAHEATRRAFERGMASKNLSPSRQQPEDMHLSLPQKTDSPATSTPGGSSSNYQTPHQSLSKPPHSSGKAAAAGKANSSSASLSSSYLRGKLLVDIVQGRGLIPPHPDAQPYVVVSFDQNESVSKEAAPSDESDDNSDHSVFSFQDDNSDHDDDDETFDVRENGRENGIDSITRKISQLNARKPSRQHRLDRDLQASTSAQSRAHRRVLSGSQPNGNGGDAVPSMASEIKLDEQDESSAATNPVWQHEAQFDVLHERGTLQIQVFDHSSGQEYFMGMTELKPRIAAGLCVDRWVPVYSHDGKESIAGQIRVYLKYQKFRAAERRGLRVSDFEFLRMIGRGTFGRVFQVRKKDTRRVYAMKVLSKREIVARKEVAHTIGERKILQQSSDCPFLLGLKFSFQSERDLYLVMDYKSGGELFHHLQREGRFPEDRARFYTAEIVLAFEHLHQLDIVYRDLKPENILLDATGHIVLCDFGLSKSDLPSDALTTTFCGTTEYLAPEVLLDEAGYSKLVDFWSLGVLVFEMCCGWSPFYDEDTQKMYKLICYGKIKFPKGVVSEDGKLFVKGLLNRNPRHRLGAKRDAQELKEHPFFRSIDFDLLNRRQVPPPFKPHVESDESTSNFDSEFTSADLMKEVPDDASVPSSAQPPKAQPIGITQRSRETPLTKSVQENFRGFTFSGDNNPLMRGTPK